MSEENCGRNGLERDARDNVETGEPDLPPEFCHYRDEGCEFAPSCLSCPFPRCLYDEPRGKQRWLKAMRSREIKRLRGSGWKVSELATLFGVSERTIQRALKEAGGGAGNRDDSITAEGRK
ncbi:MAG: helix-turn-helix domain-containing protein [Dehalococcoidales bacterium]|nr:helix-turn-helix domain-containing protein [Dehalococcoidales bacterium]